MNSCERKFWSGVFAVGLCALPLTRLFAEKNASAGLVERTAAHAIKDFGVAQDAIVLGIPSEPASRPADVRASWGYYGIEFAVTGVGSGVSTNFEKSSCLLCIRYMKEGQISAKNRAALDAQARCVEKGGLILAPAKNEEINCRRVDESTSHYLCSARSSAVCLLPMIR